VSHLDLDELRLLLSHAHESKDAGFVRSAVSRIKSRFFRPVAQPVVMPLRPGNEAKDKEAA
jgi:hypothetical protein